MVETTTADAGDSESGGVNTDLFASAEEATTERLISYLIDFVLLSVAAVGLWIAGLLLNMAAAAIINILATSVIPEQSAQLVTASGLVIIGINLGVWVVLGAVLLTYFTFLDAGKGTFGKRFRDLEVVTADGSPVTKRETAIRTAVLLVPFPVMALLGGLLGAVGFGIAVFLMAGWLLVETAMMFVSDGGQRLGDRAAGTVVVPTE